MKSLRVLAPAKINPLLLVGQPDEDGYHPLRASFQAIDLFDTITIRPAATRHLTCDVTDLSGENNLASKAIRLLTEYRDIPVVHVDIQKRIPVQAGLGGGSSDAAATLVGLNLLMGGDISHQDLFDVALACGADVPFFLTRWASANATGRGEILAAMPALPCAWVCVAKPSADTSTTEAYRQLDLQARINSDDPFHNDFDTVAPPESLQLIQQMKDAGAAAAHLCGSGSAVYGIFQERTDIAVSTWHHWCKPLNKVPEPEWIA